MAPCRLADAQSHAADTTAHWMGLENGSSSCNVPSAAHVYSLNLTTMSEGQARYLTIHPTHATQPAPPPTAAPTIAAEGGKAGFAKPARLGIGCV